VENSYLYRFVLAGGVMMIFLIPCSIAAVALIVHGLIDLRRQKVMPARIGALFRATDTAQDRAALRDQLKGYADNPMARVCTRLLPWVGMRGESWDLTVQQVTSEEMAPLYQRHSYLAVIYGVAPLMGLLGTILGMIRTFYEFSVESGTIKDLGRGINEALVTTMWGLMIAVPAYLFLSLFRQKLYRYENDLIPARVRELFAQLPGKEDS
jgi:biopolymer transport protein ExbB